MYTADTATSKHIRYAYDPEHYNADEDGHVTFVTLAWGDQSFIATSLPGTPSVLEAYDLAAMCFRATYYLDRGMSLDLDDRDLIRQED